MNFPEIRVGVDGVTLYLCSVETHEHDSATESILCDFEHGR